MPGPPPGAFFPRSPGQPSVATIITQLRLVIYNMACLIVSHGLSVGAHLPCCMSLQEDARRQTHKADGEKIRRRQGEGKRALRAASKSLPHGSAQERPTNERSRRNNPRNEMREDRNFKAKKEKNPKKESQFFQKSHLQGTGLGFRAKCNFVSLPLRIAPCCSTQLVHGWCTSLVHTHMSRT